MKFEDFQGIEATHLDYKVSLEKEKPKSWLKSVVAFANTKGGHILFGVTDNGHEPVGLDDAQSTASKISELLTSRVEPPVRYTLTPFSSRIEGRLCIDLEVAMLWSSIFVTLVAKKYRFMQFELDMVFDTH